MDLQGGRQNGICNIFASNRYFSWLPASALIDDLSGIALALGKVPFTNDCIINSLGSTT